MSEPLPTILLTRPQAQSERFARQCRGAIDASFNVVISPVMAIEHLEAPDLSGCAGVIFTSENAVHAAEERVLPIPAYCVGPNTALAAARAGFVAREAGGDASSLFELVMHAAPKGRLLHLRGEHQTGDLAGELEKAGLDVSSEVIYRQPERALTDQALECLGGAAPVILPLFSSRSATLLRRQVEEASAPLRVAALSPAVAEAWKGSDPAEIVICKRPSADSMLRAVAGLLAA